MLLLLKRLMTSSYEQSCVVMIQSQLVSLLKHYQHAWWWQIRIWESLWEEGKCANVLVNNLCSSRTDEVFNFGSLCTIIRRSTLWSILLIERFLSQTADTIVRLFGVQIESGSYRGNEYVCLLANERCSSNKLLSLLLHWTNQRLTNTQLVYEVASLNRCAFRLVSNHERFLFFHRKRMFATWEPLVWVCLLAAPPLFGGRMIQPW